MRKIFLMLAATLLFAFPAFAQRGQHVGGHMGGGGGVRIQHEQHSAPARGGENRRQDTRPFVRDDHRQPEYGGRNRDERGFHEQHDMRGYHWGRGQREIREHWDGRRFDHDYWEHHWGREHRFYWNHCTWYGPAFYPGSYFWFGGVDFVIIEQVPSYWYDDEIYVDYIDGYGYAIINPLYPGVYYHVDVRF